MKELIVSIYDSDSGELGLILDRIKRSSGYSNASTEGRLIAHDLLEHQKGLNAIGSVGDELLALGGVWYVRGRHGCISETSIASSEEHIAADIANLGGIYLSGVPLREKVKREYKQDHFDWVDCASDIAKKELIYCDHNDKDINEYLTKARHLIKKGYMMAESRFKNCICPYNLFKDIERQINGIEIHYEYQRWEIQYSIKYSKANIEQLHEWY